MNFEWDENKNKENVNKHDLDFSDAWQVFAAPMFIEADTRYDYGENRFTAIGFLRDLVIVLVFTERENDIIRIITFRKALKYEREKFHTYIRDQLGTPESDVG